MKVSTRIISEVSIILFILASIFFSTPLAKADNPEWKYFSNPKGTEAFTENNDFIWIATTNPPNNSEYPEILKFQKSSESIVDSIQLISYVKLLEIDSKGNLWIAGTMGLTEGSRGLSKYDGTTLKTWTPAELETLGFPSSKIRSMKIDNLDNIWFGMANGGIVKFDGTQVIVYNSSNSNLPSGLFLYVSNIDFDSKNNVWLSMFQGGIAKFENEEWIVYDVNNSKIPTNNVNDLKIDSHDNIWLATDKGLIKYDNQYWVTYNKENSQFPDNNLTKLKTDLDDNIWFNINGSWGIFKYDGNTFTNFTTSNSELKGNNITSMFVDSHNNKWFGVSDFGDFTGYNIYKEGGVNFTPVSVKNMKYSTTLIYPNPAYDFIEININTGASPNASGIQIFDMLGIEVISTPSLRDTPQEGNFRIDVSGLQPGVYFIRIGDRVEKFVKM